MNQSDQQLVHSQFEKIELLAWRTATGPGGNDTIVAAEVERAAAQILGAASDGAIQNLRAFGCQLQARAAVAHFSGPAYGRVFCRAAQVIEAKTQSLQTAPREG